MIRKRLVVSAAVIAALALCQAGMASRRMPEKVEPLIFDGIMYTAPAPNAFYENSREALANRGRMGVVEAWDTDTGKKLWEKEIYQVVKDPDLDPDMQDVYITSLGLRRNLLTVTNEYGDVYVLDLNTQQVTQKTVGRKFGKLRTQVTTVIIMKGTKRR